MWTLRPLLAMTLLALLALPAAARGDDLLPPDRPAPAVIDHYIEALLKTDGVTPAPPADDATLIRRLTLDLVGRVPTTSEADAYIGSGEPDKRAKLVDRL